VADPGFTNEGQGRAAARIEVQRPRREGLGADEVGVARGDPWDWEGSGMPARKKSILDLKMGILGAFWTKCFAVQLFV